MDRSALSDLSVVIPTFRRPDQLARCLEAVVAQTAWGAGRGEIIVVDNCPLRSSEAIVAAAPPAPVPVRYLHEPRPGISHARNAGVAAARGELVAFVDDDNLASATMLQALRAALVETDAAAAFGRYVALPDGPCPARCLAFVQPYERDLGPVRKDVTDKHAYLGTCASMFRRSVLVARGQPFDPALGLVGGEDSALLHDLAVSGGRLVYEPSALGFELVPLSRLNRESHRRRRFRNGQIRTANADGPAQRLLWVAVGVAQVVLHGIGAAIGDLLGREDRAEYHRGQIWSGIGKVLWRHAGLPFYGREPAPGRTGRLAAT